jgi:sugar phosphate isomerase/epimerase
MKLGIGSYTYPWGVGLPGFTPNCPLSPVGLLDKAKRLDVKVVQFCDNLSIADLSKSELDLLLGLAQDYRIDIEVGARGISPSGMMKHLELAGRCRSKFVRFVVDSGTERPTPTQVVERVKPFVPAYSDRGIIIAFENHDRFSVRELIDIVSELGPNYTGICLDTVNSFGACEMPLDVVKALAPFTKNIHVKDFQIERIESQMGFEIIGAPAGGGRLDIPWMIGYMRSAGRDVNVIIELWTPRGLDIDSTVRLEEQWADDSVKYMRKYLKD